MTCPSVSLKRVKRKTEKSQNPLFEKWLKEWKEEARKNGSDMHYCLNKALKSLQKFPVKLYSGKECIVLENFGAKICKLLDDKLEKYRSLHPEGEALKCKHISVFPTTYDREKNNSVNNLKIILKPDKNSNNEKGCEKILVKNKGIDSISDLEFNENENSHYVPANGSVPYAILITLLEKTQEKGFGGFLTETELQAQAQALCDTSFTKALPSSYFTAWSSVDILFKKNLVKKQGKPAKFSLTEKGTDLAIKLKEVDISKNSDGGIKTQNLVSPVKHFATKKVKKILIEEIAGPNLSLSEIAGTLLGQPFNKKEPELALESEESVFLFPGAFEIKLLVDTQERDNKFQQANNMTMKQLKSRNVNFEIRHLKVGDFIWIAKDLHYGHELVLPFVAERKRMDDLASSIKDGRFHEQKCRLKQSGVENLIYLVEKYGNENQRLGLPLPTLLQAISNTQILNGFTVKITRDHEDSMRYLDCMTSQLNNIFKAKTLTNCKKANLTRVNLSDDLISLMTFTDFNKGSEKNKKPTVRNMLMKHLLQLNGVSIEKASAIVQFCPTQKALMKTLKQPSGDKSLADLTSGGLNRSIGSATAKQIQMLYTWMTLR